MQAEGVARAKVTGHETAQDLQVMWKARQKCDGMLENEGLEH